MKNRICAVCGFIISILFSVMCFAEEPETIQSGDFEYYINDDGTITLSDWSGKDTTVEIPEEIDGKTVAVLGNQLFFRCDRLTEVVIPASVVTIGERAFHACERLKSIEIPDSVTTIGDVAFCKCSLVKSIEIPASVTSIGRGAFSQCYGLKSIEIPASVTTIGDEPFGLCEHLTKISVAEDNPNYIAVDNVLINKTEQSIVQYLSASGASEYVIPEGILKIGNNAFVGCYDLTSIVLPESVTTIGDRAFSGCNFTDIVLPESVTTIGENAFERCSSLRKITIPESVTTIGKGAFSDCMFLTEISVSENNGNYAVTDQVLFNTNEKILVCCLGERISGNIQFRRGL